MGSLAWLAPPDIRDSPVQLLDAYSYRKIAISRFHFSPSQIRMERCCTSRRNAACSFEPESA
jgi:hypothetical protein